MNTKLISSNLHLIVVALYAYILMYYVKEDDYVTMTILTLSTIVLVCNMMKNNRLLEGQSNMVPPISTNSESDDMVSEDMGSKEDSDKNDVPVGNNIMRSLPNAMGPFDGLCLQTGNSQSWMKTPFEVPLVPNDALFSYLGSQGPQKPVFSDNSALNGPPIDGVTGSDKKLFMFANNRTSPNCCPSTFSTSTGCVCTTKNQRDFIASRGNQGPIKLEM